MFEMKEVWRTLRESTCLKRMTACALLDEEGELLALASNRCSPPKDGCPRLGLIPERETYPDQVTCNWEHAEMRALSQIKPDKRPITMYLFGHDWPCPQCEEKLRSAGVKYINVYNKVGGLKNG